MEEPINKIKGKWDGKEGIRKNVKSEQAVILHLEEEEEIY